MGGFTTISSPRYLNTDDNATVDKGGVPGFLCRFVNVPIIATKCGAKKPGAFICRKSENIRGGFVFYEARLFCTGFYKGFLYCRR